MPPSIIRITLLTILLTSLAACSSILPAPPPGTVVFQDDFSRTASGWDRVRAETYSTDYLDHGYHISISAPETIVWGRPHLNFQDVRMHVDVQRLTGSEDNLFGLICHFQDPDNYIFFTISSDGFAGIGAVVAGDQQMLSADSMLPSEAVLPGVERNHLEAACIGEELTLTVNGTPILNTESPLAAWGDVGVLAGSRTETPVEVRFEHFSVLQP